MRNFRTNKLTSAGGVSLVALLVLSPARGPSANSTDILAAYTYQLDDFIDR